ncbi:MAG TPA: xanthine dehydrogenase family protein molybdopterin-binding subunit [Candidatus Acidoferrales bacterium]|nr:xanthine dehydrogenase family protein molybdopterin-binding subunit [Candidatus Acidoferrales bacterium]
MKTSKVIGQPVARIEGAAKVTGGWRYAADTLRPGALYGKVLRSPLPHARIVHIDTSKAQSVVGVKAIITARDVSPRLVGATLRDMPVLARDRVRYIGEDVAAVAATDPDIAEEAVALIAVDYEELPAVFDPLEAMKAEAPLLHPDYPSYRGPPTMARELKNVQTLVRGGKGDIEKGFAEADHIFANSFRTQLVHQGYIEPYACTVEVDGEGRIAVWAANQSVFKLRKALAEYLEEPQEKIVIYPSNMGGSFGAKDFLSLVPAAYYLSKATGKPVRFVKTYSEELMASSPRHPAVVFLRTGVKKDGRLWAWEGKTFYNGGAYGAYKPNPQGSMSGAYMVAGSYSVPHTRLEGYCVYTNQVPCGYFRAPGEVQTLFAVESHMDMIAEQMGIDPIEFRLRNALRKGDTRATGEPLTDPRCVEVLKEAARISQWRNSRAQAKGRRLFGRGVALGDRHVGHGESSFELVLEKDGTLRLLSGVGDQGVGAYTMHCQVAAEILGVSPRAVALEVKDTSSAPYDQGIKGARGTHIEGQAVARAASSLIEALRSVAAAHWGVAVEQTSWAGGGVRCRLNGRLKRLELKELARLSEAPVRGVGRYAGHKPDVYSFQAIVADVEVDGETGAVAVRRLYFVYDVGTVINPLIHQGQIEGGIVQGLGYALTEELCLDEGRVTSLSLADYKMPNIADLPPLTTSLVRAKVGPGPFGAKAVAEAGISVVAPAVANAVYRATGVRIQELPITAEKIREGLACASIFDRRITERQRSVREQE